MTEKSPYEPPKADLTNHADISNDSNERKRPVLVSIIVLIEMLFVILFLITTVFILIEGIVKDNVSDFVTGAFLTVNSLIAAITLYRLKKISVIFWAISLAYIFYDSFRSIYPEYLAQDERVPAFILIIVIGACIWSVAILFYALHLKRTNVLR